LKESNNVNEDLMSKQKAKMSTTAYKKAIEQLGLTQEGAGDVVGLSPRQAQRVVGGHAPVPRPVAKLLTLILKRKISVEEATEAG
jgi:hypothetical protein